MLRDYQQRTIDMLYASMREKDGNPVAVLPTGAGKSHIVAALCKDAVQNWPETQILMLTHVKELIEQNAEKMLLHWPDAPLGIYSAGLKRKELNSITFAGIQSIAKKANLLGHIDVCVIDECHLLNNTQQGSYRKLINDLLEINPNLRVIGLTATPYRLGQGLLTEGDDALFDYLVEPVTIEELVKRGYLAPLKSKATSDKLATDNVAKRGGEFVASELQKAVNTDPLNHAIVSEVIQKAGDRKAWLFFCSGVEHSYAVRNVLRDEGIAAETVTGDTPADERARILSEFKSGKIRALTNANVLTTGFDYPDIDLIAMLRPTMSPSLYVQMAGRGLRVKSHTDHCLVLDFAENVERHGPITNVIPPRKKGSKSGEAPVKICDQCHEILHLSVRVCPECGYQFPERPKALGLKLSDADIMADSGREMKVRSWKWYVHSTKSNKQIARVVYYGALSDPPVTEYLCLGYEGFAGIKALAALQRMSEKSGAKLGDIPDVEKDIDFVCQRMTVSKHPRRIKYKKQKSYYTVIERDWTDAFPPPEYFALNT